MTHFYLSRAAREAAIKQSLGAILDLDEIICGARKQSNALSELAETLASSDYRSPQIEPVPGGPQFANLYQRAALFRNDGRSHGVELAADALEILSAFRDDRAAVVELEKLKILREFCLGLNHELISESSGRAFGPSLALGSFAY